MKKYQWMKTDTAAIMFAALHTKTKSRVVRLAVVLKDEDVDVAVLRRAVKDVLPAFPGFAYRVKQGFFWGYLEHTDVPPAVCEEAQCPSVSQWIGRDGGPDYRVLYYKRRISLEASHVLGDGTGLLMFLKAIVARYLVLRGTDIPPCDGIIQPQDMPSAALFENAYTRHYTGEKLKSVEREKAYQLEKQFEKDYLNVVFGLIPVRELKLQAKPRNLTITEYLAAAMILAIIRSTKQPINGVISIAIPVNMRKYFPSETLRNFSTHLPVEFSPRGRTDWAFSEVCEAVRGQLQQKITHQTVQAFINSTYSLTVNPLIRIIPGFIKKPGLTLIQKKAHQSTVTVTISNLGNIALPAPMLEQIERIDLVGGDPRPYGLTTFCGVVGVNEFLNFCFSVTNRDTSLCRAFFGVLAEEAIPVRVESTSTAGDTHVNHALGKMHSEDRAACGKYCEACRVELGEVYSACPLCARPATERESVITFFKTAEYPQQYHPLNQKGTHAPRQPLSLEKIKAYLSL